MSYEISLPSMSFISPEGKHLCRHDNNWFDDKLSSGISKGFPKCYLFLDKAKQTRSLTKVFNYFDGHKNNLIQVFVPTESPKFMGLQEI